MLQCANIYLKVVCFFYDILPPRNLKEEDIPVIEKRMHELVKKNYKFDLLEESHKPNIKIDSPLPKYIYLK